MLLQEIDDGLGEKYQLHAEVRECDHPPGQYNVVFYTFYSGAKDPSDRRIRAQFVLNKDALRRLGMLTHIEESPAANKLKSMLGQLKK